MYEAYHPHQQCHCERHRLANTTLPHPHLLPVSVLCVCVCEFDKIELIRRSADINHVQLFFSFHFRHPSQHSKIPTARPKYGTPFPIINQSQKGLFEKIVDYLINDGPSSRYGMICKSCYGHNGKQILTKKITKFIFHTK